MNPQNRTKFFCLGDTQKLFFQCNIIVKQYFSGLFNKNNFCFVLISISHRFNDGENNKINNFEIKYNNLIKKLNNDNIRFDINDIYDANNYEEKEIINENDKLNYNKNKILIVKFIL